MTSNDPDETAGTILIVGASRGLGHAMAAEFLRRNWAVIGTVRGTGHTLLHALADTFPGRVEVEELDVTEREQIAARDDVVKASLRDLPMVVAKRMNAATTVASTAHFARLAGISVFATGGIGGVHRGASENFDESADLQALGSIPVVVVCAGVKSILDVGATLERLETYSVPVLVFGSDRFPGFYLRDSGFAAPWRVDTQQEVVAAARAQARLDLPQATLVAQPLPANEQMDPGVHDRLLKESLAAAAEQGITGKDLTPFMLEWFHSRSDGASVRINRRLAVRNAELAARIAAAM